MDSSGPNKIYRFAMFTLDAACRTLSRDGEDIPLAPKEFQTLTLLVQAAGQAVSREVLIAAAWPDTSVSDNSLARCISSLRRHLGAEAIEAVPKFGYRFTIPVTHSQPVEPAAASAPPAKAPLWFKSALHIWVPAAALVLVLALSAAWLIAARPVADAAAEPTWIDPQTHLTWARNDNGFDVTRQQAADFCRNLTLAGHRDWRLPTIDEVQTLYDTGVSVAGTWGPSRPVYWHVKGNIHLTGGETAGNLTVVTDITPAGEEQSFDFSYGRRNFDPTDFSADHRALCVR
jgi:DNA-binding winged helix-turn-helix (wHTH) protein